MNLTKEEETVRNILINVASKKQLIYYSDLCKTANLRLDMSIPADRGKIGEVLGHISRYEHENVHIPEHTRSLSGSLLGYKTIP